MFVSQFCGTWEFPPSTGRNRCLQKHSINPIYIQQQMIYHFKTYLCWGTFIYNSTRGQLNNEGGGELHEVKQSRDKLKIGK